MLASKPCLLILLSILVSMNCKAQETEVKPNPPAFKLNRSDENYGYLKNGDLNPYKRRLGDGLKQISLNKQNSFLIDFGGQYRPRLEYFNNLDWTEEDVAFYSQRIDIYANFTLGKHVRFFGELIHGYTSNEKQIVESDELDLHQGFIEFYFRTAQNGNVSFRFGRQEMILGSSRLISNREGPNIKRSFDLIQGFYQNRSVTTKAFYGKAIIPNFFAFDNRTALFDSNSPAPAFWGIDMKFSINGIPGNNEGYYIGFHSNYSVFSDAIGEEVRHSIGLRRYDTPKNGLSYNTEMVYQFGSIGDNSISAFNIETDWKYALSQLRWQTKIGLKLDWSSGDRRTGDGKIQTFNPLFVNPAIYNLAAINTPANLIALHPNITVYPFEGFSIYLDYSLLYRTSRNDGLYAPPRFQTREANGIKDRHIGNVAGMNIRYEINANLDIELRSSYFIAGAFLIATGSSNNTFHLSPTLSFKF